MPVSGLVVTFSDDKLMSAQAVMSIKNKPQIIVGPLEATRMAIVLDTESSVEDRILWEWLNELSGVHFVDVVFVGFEDAANEMTTIPI